MSRLFSAVAAGFFSLVPPRVHAHEAMVRNPVLLVHGMGDTASSMEPLACSLRKRGWDVKTMSYRPNWGQKGIEKLSEQVAQFVDVNYLPGQKIDLVAYSLGGLVTRHYLQRLGGLERVQRYITISAPHHGSLLAYLLPNDGCRQMRFGSTFLRDLASDADRLKALDFTSIHTPLDLIVIPFSSSEMPQAKNETLWVALHPLMVLQPNAHRAVAAALSRGR